MDTIQYVFIKIIILCFFQVEIVWPAFEQFVIFKYITSQPMSLHCAFLFPKKDFRLTFMSTVGYISDNVFYQIDLATGQTQIQHSPNGRSYQAFTASHKRGLTVLADYGKNPNLYFQYRHQSQQSFEVKDICKLEINKLALSIDNRYLLISCGIPEKSLIIYDIEQRQVLRGENSSVKVGEREVKEVSFNPFNSRIFSVMFKEGIQIYEFKDSLQVASADSQLQEFISVKKIAEISGVKNGGFCETMLWDEIGNIYVSDGKTIFVYSLESNSDVAQYDLEGDFQENENVVCCFLLTKKHLVIVYSSGRFEWVNKYYPDLMEEEDIALRPFYLDKYFQFDDKNKKIRHASYNHEMQKILVSHTNGFFSVMDRPAESNEVDEDEQENNKKAQERIGNAERSKKLDIQCTQFGPYHVNHVIFCKEIPATALLMTVSKAGRLVLWSTTQKTALTYCDIGGEIISADANKNFTILSVSKKGGVVQFFSLSDLENIFLVKQFQLLREAELEQIAFSLNSQELACMSSSKKIFYLLTKESEDIQVLGYVNLPYVPFSICWNTSQKSTIKANFQNLFACIGFGILSINSPAAVSEKRKGKQLELNCEIHALRTDPHQKTIAILPSGELLTSGKDKLLKKYKQPEESISKFNPETKTALPPPLEEFDAHDLEVSFMKIDGKRFISCGKDGTVQLRTTDNFNNYETFIIQGWKNSNLSACSFSQEEGLFFTCGKDGSVCMWKSKEIEIRSSDELIKRPTNLKKIVSASENIKYYEDVIEEEYLGRMKQSIAKKKKTQMDKILHIKKQLKQLLIENEGHQELEKLERDEIVIDLDSRQISTQKMIENCEKIKKESLRKVLYNQVYRKKLKELTWDQMQEHLRAINGLKNNYLVYNYQIRKISKREKRMLELIMNLRRNQIKEIKKRGGNQIIDCQFYKNKNVINGGIPQPLILTIFEKKEDKKEEKGKKKKQEEAVEKLPEDLEEIPKDEDWTLLYSSFELFSDNAKRNQIIMMQNLIIKIKEAFNKEFNKLMKLRQSQNQIINDKNKRIVQICEELKRPNDVIIGNRNILENPDSILEIDPKEIPFVRYLSKEQRQKLEKERLRELERLRALAEDDSSQRALQEMMGGTLEEKKTSLLEVTVEREKWMDRPLEEMSEEEKAKLKEYQQKKQKAEEQKERIVKKLEAELRKLKQQIEEVMDKYDEKLFNLVRRRIEYDLRIEEQELYCLKLNLSMVNQKEESKKYEQLKQKLSSYETRALDLQNYLRELQKHASEIEAQTNSKSSMINDTKRLGENEPKVKTIEKTVFDQYQTNLKKRREMEEKLLETNKIAQYQINSLDPMKQIESKILAQQSAKNFKFFIPEIKNLQKSFDFPDSLLTVLENRFNLKKQHLEAERKLKGIKETIFEVQDKIAQSQTKENQDQQQLEAIQAFLEKSKSDLEIQCRIKQGQVQIDNNTPVPQMHDALLISKSSIDQKNANILEKAGLKIDVIKQIKSCKIEVTEETLNLERKQGLIDQLSSMIKQVQMLKVKKEMQTALAKKDTKINQNELRSLKEQIEKVRKEGDKRINLFLKKIQKVGQQIDSIKKENKQLEVQKWNLQNTVKQREKIKEMMVGENGGGNQEAAEKFEQISINRKLFDKAKQQTEQIELLREELSKLKAKTFANFSSVQR